MFKLREFILSSLFIIKLSNAAQDSNLLTHYDFKVKNSEATCRLVNHPNLPEDRRTLAGRGCMCDQECIKYKDCCKDSTYYRPNEQSLPPSHHCSEPTAVYLMAQCPQDWEDSETKSLCEKSIQPLEDEDISLILPVSNIKTRETYGNRYCAACNNDLDTKNWVQFPMGVAAAEAPPGYLKPAPIPTPSPYAYIPPGLSPPSNGYSYPYPSTRNNELNYEPESGNCNRGCKGKESCNQGCKVNIINNIIPNPSPSILLDIHLYIYNDTLIDGRNTQWPIQLRTAIPSSNENFYNTFGRAKRNSKQPMDFDKYASKAQEICGNAKFDAHNKEFVSRYTNKDFICRFEPMLPERANQFTRTCVPFLERKCPNGYENETIREECLISTNIVYNKNKKPYRNKDCARCHGEKEENVNGTPQNTRSSLAKIGSAASSGGATAGQGDFKPTR